MADGESCDDQIVTVLVYGLPKRHRAVRLIDSLAAIPCCPSTVFRIDGPGRLIGVVDQLYSPPRVYFVKVYNWNDRQRKLPVIGWTLRARNFSAHLAGKWRRILAAYTSGVRTPRPMEVKIDVKKHAELHAKMARFES